MTGVSERLSAALADRYRIERELGAGGMATVYLAQDLKHDRLVAVKVLKPELDLEPARLRAMTAPQWQSPHGFVSTPTAGFGRVSIKNLVVHPLLINRRCWIETPRHPALVTRIRRTCAPLHTRS